MLCATRHLGDKASAEIRRVAQGIAQEIGNPTVSLLMNCPCVDSATGTKDTNAW